MIDLHDLPRLNAALNAVATGLLLAGYGFIRRRRIRSHQACMAAALVVSTLFLGSYAIYHWGAGSVRFTAEGWPRAVYYAVLATHVPLAAAVLPLAIVTVGFALRGRFDRHVKIARWTLPIWLYVSFTGVVVYLMLYVWFPSEERPG